MGAASLVGSNVSTCVPRRHRKNCGTPPKILPRSRAASNLRMQRLGRYSDHRASSKGPEDIFELGRLEGAPMIPLLPCPAISRRMAEPGSGKVHRTKSRDNVSLRNLNPLVPRRYMILCSSCKVLLTTEPVPSASSHSK